MYMPLGQYLLLFQNMYLGANNRTFYGLQVSPIEYGHVLLIPGVLDHLPQRIDPESFLLALHMAAETASPYFRPG
jgi:hypothetical protein